MDGYRRVSAFLKKNFFGWCCRGLWFFVFYRVLLGGVVSGGDVCDVVGVFVG